MATPQPASPHAADLTEAALLQSALIRLGRVIRRMRVRPLAAADDGRLRKLELAECLVQNAMPPDSRTPA